MGTVTSLRAGQQSETIAAAIGGYLASINRAESRRTREQYAATLRRFRQALGADADLASLDGTAVRLWIEDTWGARKPATYNRALDVFRSAYAYWTLQGWAAEDPTAPMRRRRVAADRSRALSRADVEQLLTGEDIALRERVLWRPLGRARSSRSMSRISTSAAAGPASSGRAQRLTWSRGSPAPRG
jgi:site-specific recombinase XerD